MSFSPALQALVSKASNKYRQNSGRTEKPKEGRTQYRILGALNGDPNAQYWADLGVHWIKADENSKPLAVVGDCEVCYDQPSVLNAAIETAVAGASDEVSKKLFESWRSRKVALLNAINRVSGELVILELTGGTFNSFLGLWTMYLEHGQNILDFQAGLDIVITRTGTGLNTKYELAVAPGISAPVTPDQIAKGTDLGKFIADQFFRGEEQKALNFIAQIAGIPVPRIGASTPTPALAAASASVAPAMTTTAVDPVALAAAQVAAAHAAAQKAAIDAAAVAAQKAAMDAQNDPVAVAQRALAAAQAAAAAAAAPVTPAPVLTAPPQESVSQDQQDAVLAELQSLLAS